MHILLVNHAPIPVFAYGGTERVIWDLGKTLVQLGHKVSYLVPAGSHCDFADVIIIRPGIDWREQIPANVDLAHFQFNPAFNASNYPDCPFLVTEHGNGRHPTPLPLNTVFVSKNHAQRYGSSHYVYNGLDWSSYGSVSFTQPRPHYHFLGKAEWKVKNLQGAIDVAHQAQVKLAVLGGSRLNFRRGFRFTLSRSIQFYGMVGGARKIELLNTSRGLIFPVRWYEPFGLAVIESLYFGCPIFATPYGALPELVPKTCGTLATSTQALADAIKTGRYDPQECHQQALNNFSAVHMAKAYLNYYQRILDGEVLNRETPFMQDTDRALPWEK